MQTHPAFCVYHPELEPLVHVGGMRTTGASIVIEQHPNDHPRLLVEITDDDPLSPTVARGIAQALNEAARIAELPSKEDNRWSSSQRS